MLGEVVMIIPLEEMLRAAQIYLDSVYKVPVEAVGFREVRTNGKKKRFEIKLVAKASGEEKGITEHPSLIKEQIAKNTALSKETDELPRPKVVITPSPGDEPKRLKTLEEIRAGNNTDTGA